MSKIDIQLFEPDNPPEEKKITKVTLNTDGRLDLYLGSDMVFVDRLGGSCYSKIINIKFSSEHSDLVVETESGKIKNYNFRNVVSWDME